MDISVILVSYNTSAMTREALNTLNASRTDNQFSYEIFVVDNASRDDSADMISREFPEVRFFKNAQNVGFGRANNQVLHEISGRYVLLLNTDAFVEPDSLLKTLTYMDAHPDVGILGVRLIGRDGLLQPSCRYFPTAWNLFLNKTGLFRIFRGTQLVDDMGWDHASVRECDWVPGCYYLVRREVIEQVGLFDKRFFLYYEEVDHCFATKKAGWKVVYSPDTMVIHVGGESAKTDNSISSVSRQVSSLQMESEILYFRKNSSLMHFAAYILLFNLAEAIMVVKTLIKSKFKHTGAGVANIRMFFKTLITTRLGRLSIH